MLGHTTRAETPSYSASLITSPRAAASARIVNHWLNFASSIRSLNVLLAWFSSAQCHAACASHASTSAVNLASRAAASEQTEWYACPCAFPSPWF